MQYLGKYAVAENNLGQIKMKAKVIKKFGDGEDELDLDIVLYDDESWPEIDD